MIIEANTELCKRKQFIITAYEHKNISKDEFDAEILKLNKQILENLNTALEANKVEVRTNLFDVKKSLYSDGEMKREIANMIIAILKPNYTNDEIKGVFRQGYKTMRLK